MTTETIEELPPLNIFDLCETDDDSLENGKWFEDVFTAGDGIRIRIRSFRSAASVKYRQGLQTKYRKFEKKGVFPDHINERMLIEQLAGVIIVDWAGIKDRDGVEIPYSKEAALRLCEKLRLFREVVTSYAMNVDNYRVELPVDEIVGN